MKYFQLHNLRNDGLPLIYRDIPQATSIELHKHDYIELVFVHGGNGVHLLQGREGLLTTSIIKGDVFTILPGECHAYRDCRDFRIYNLCISTDYLQRLAPELSKMAHYARFFTLNRQDCTPRLHLSPAAFQQVEFHMRQIVNALNSRRDTRLWAIQVSLENLLLSVFDSDSGSIATATVEATTDERLFQSIERLELHPERPLKLQEEARLSGMSLSSYAHKFRQAVGYAPNEYVTFLRLEKARRQIEETNRPLTDIALDCGFCDSNYLTRQFRKRYGITPARHRRSLRFYPGTSQTAPAFPR
ncbi:MAG: helix-turn-helix domain-containing protein [Victivallales bacterium]|nr:helix-turn-helix domain-containing protein [Victivallales bacterium]